MGSAASVQSAATSGREFLGPGNHPSPEAGEGNSWENIAGESSHRGWGSSGGSSRVDKDQGWAWADKSTKTQCIGWGESATISKDNDKMSSSNDPNSPRLEDDYNGWVNESAREDYNGWGELQPAHSSNDDNPALLVPPSPSAPRLPVSPAGTDHLPSLANDAAEDDSRSLCIICWEARVDGACVPCGHMAGCFPCLRKISSKGGQCPVCRAEIVQIVKLYAV